MKKISLFFTIICLFSAVFAQTGNIDGTVKQQDKKAVSAAVVTLWEGNMLKYETLTTENGFFQMQEINIGTYRLNIATSLGDSSSQVVSIHANKTTHKDILLKSPILKEVEVVNRKKDYAEKGYEREKMSAKSAAPARKMKGLETKSLKLTESYSAPITTSAPPTSATISVSEDSDADGASDGIAMSGDIKSSEEGEETYKWDEEMEKSDVKSPSADIKSGTLTAGEVSDFGKWNLWQNIGTTDLEAWTKTWEIFPKNRYTVQLSNEKDYPVVGANVYLTTKKGTKMWVAKTDNTGKAELWENIFVKDSLMEKNPHILIQYQGKEYDIKKAKKFQEGINFVKIVTPCAEKQIIDIAFVVDATGSMDDEINYLKTELYDVIGKVKDTLKTADLRLASVFYRDNGDAYLTRETELSGDIGKTVDFIKANNAGGGGDTPEAVEEALKASLRNLKWRENATSKMLFLILDAPPHEDFVTKVKIKQLIKEAAEKGIRIIPIVCSGADKSTEYLMRTFALASNGTYLFLTNHSGVGGGHIDPTTDKFEVVLFNNLLRNTIVNFSQIQSCEQTQILAKQDTGNVNEMVNVEVVDSTQNTRIEKQPLTWKFYPNPTTGILKVEVNGQMNELYVADITGKVLQRYERKGDELMTIDISEFPNGVYLLRYEYAPDKFMTGKVILAH